MANRADVNKSLRRTTIKGRDYIDVAQRIDGFWALYPDGRIVTEMLNDSGSRCTFRATCYDGRGEVIATGHAFEDRKGSVNQTSYVENCETSAIGRALGNAGIGSTEQVASADEVRWAMEQQEANAPESHSKAASRQSMEESTLLAAKRRLAAACAAYEARSGYDAPSGWAAEGVKQRADYPAPDMPEDAQADWFESVAVEFETA